jgi:hypothetical protein
MMLHFNTEYVLCSSHLFFCSLSRDVHFLFYFTKAQFVNKISCDVSPAIAIIRCTVFIFDLFMLLGLIALHLSESKSTSASFTAMCFYLSISTFSKLVLLGYYIFSFPLSC